MTLGLVSNESLPSKLPASGNSATPLHATPRDLSRPTEGDQVALVADLLGTPLMPWQRLAADIALERKPDGSFAYPIVVISVPRQSGKTTLLRALAVQQMIAHAKRELYYTAQTGKDARARWEQLVELIESDPRAGRIFAVRKSAGSAAVIHKRRRSKFSPFAPTAESLHGYTPHTVMIDEAFSLSEVEGRMLMGAIIPAQATIVDRQLYIVSTKGTAESTFFHDWVDAGRAGQAGVALIEYAAAPGVDAYDPAAWPTFHPALGITIGPDAIADAAGSISRSEFERAYANRPVATASHLVPSETWEPQTVDGLAHDGEPWAMIYDVAHDGSAATLAAVWATADGRHAGVVLEHQSGYTWLPEAVVKWVDAGRPTGLFADDGGAAREVTAVLSKGPQRYQPTTLSGREFATASGAWLERVRSDTWRHDGTADGVYGLAQRPVGDTWAWSRRHSVGDVSAPIAFTVGSYAVEHLLKSPSRPVIDFGA